MNDSGVITPKADQPRVTTENLRQGEQAPSLQYRVSSFRTYTPRTENRSSSTRLVR
jgi:hypothetical protein